MILQLCDRSHPPRVREAFMPSEFCVMVVDDDPDTVESTAEILRMYGFRVLTAGGGNAALRLAACEQPDVVISDLAMPRGDGYELAERLRQASGKPPVLVAVTGWTTRYDKVMAADAGFDLFLAKPVDPALLVGVVRRIRDAVATRK